MANIVVLDLETSGLDPVTDAILEIGAVALDNKIDPVSTFHSRVYYAGDIDPAATAVHGLTNEDLATEPSVGQVLRSLVDWCPPAPVLAGQNVWFDAMFLRRAFQSLELDYPFGYHIIDIWSIGQFVLPRRGRALDGYGLDDLSREFGLVRPEPHSAEVDALLSAHILKELDRAVSE